MWFRLIVTLAAVLIAFDGITSLRAVDEPPASQGKPESGSTATIPVGFQQRTARTKESLTAAGANEESERAVAAALNWLARHQNPDGSWGCVKFRGQCKDPRCGFDGDKAGADYPVAATSFGLLPFLAAGMSHESNGPYQVTIRKGLIWMVKTQDSETGLLGPGGMYEHALGTMTLCEAYGLSQDDKLKPHAHAAVNYLEDAQNDATGGWHYTANPPTIGDLSVTGWQIMALKSAQMAGLKTDLQTRHRAKRFLRSVSKGKSDGLCSYMPDSGPAPGMSAVGLLCNQNLGLKQNDPAQDEAKAYLLANRNHAKDNLYFQYYATQAIRNLPGKDWDQWNAVIRDQLVADQIQEGCAAGSWSPKGKGHVAGRLMMTSCAALTLEVYYRYQLVYEPEKNPQP